MTGFNLARYTLDIYGPESALADEGSAYRWGISDEHVLALLPEIMSATAISITDLLPEGYSVRVCKEGEAT